MKHYREVQCSDRLPEKAKYYFTNQGIDYFHNDGKRKGFDHPETRYWLEELPPTDSAQERYEKACNLIADISSPKKFTEYHDKQLRIAAGLKD